MVNAVLKKLVNVAYCGMLPSLFFLFFRNPEADNDVMHNPPPMSPREGGQEREAEGAETGLGGAAKTGGRKEEGMSLNVLPFVISRE